MSITLRDSDGTTRLIGGDLLAPGGATGDVLTQQADGTYAPAAGAPPGTPTLGQVLASGGDPDGNPITAALEITPDGTENDPALQVDVTNSGNHTALAVFGCTTLDRSGVGADPFIVKLDGTTALQVDEDGKARVTPSTNTTSAQPALDVNAAAAITPLFRLRTNSNDVLTINKTGDTVFSTPGVGPWLSGSASFVQIVAAGSGSDIELCDASSGIVVQVTDDGRLGFYNHAATVKQTGVAVTAAAIHAALVNLGLITA